ncbi:hypothetical protein IWQ62_004705 [Dispira parvispora]|uniref:Carbohydrate kinase PfkB domain-containing protein n=1 Tax=Dispira parvispora TaxID=1520584 RepID=A0A9W8E5X0_9FUNG|nr:hypothetical protein IWQ62_004705 [Dispira parvispora]
MSECIVPNEILIIGPNAASQTTLFFDSFHPYHVNRAYKKSHSIGGKGQNCALACNQYGQPHKITLLQTLGGPTGEFITKVLHDKGLHHVTVTTSGATRTCTTLLDANTGTMTELIEPTVLLDGNECRQFEDSATRLIQWGRDTLRIIALCGSCPNGMTSSTYHNIAVQKPPHTFLFLDAVKDVHQILATQKVDMLKVNGEEFLDIVSQLQWIPHSTNGSSELATYAARLPNLAKQFFEQYSLRFLAITNGPHQAYLFEQSASQFHIFYLPHLESVLFDMYLSKRDEVVVQHSENFLPPTVTLAHRSRLLEWETDNEEYLAELQRSQKHSASSARSVLRYEADSAMNGTTGVYQGTPWPTRLLLNPLGAGDTANGVFLCDYLAHQDAVQAFAKGLAAASASCLVTDYTGLFDQGVMQGVLERIRIQPESFVTSSETLSMH